MNGPKTGPASSPPKAKRTRLSAEDRRSDLIRSAIEVFAKHGFEGSTTKAIAEASGVSEAVIFRHFASKEELYKAMLDHRAAEADVDGWMQQLLEFAASNDDESLFRSLASKIVESYRRDPQFQRLMLYSALEGHEMSKIMHQQRGLPTFELLKAYVARRQKQGAFRQGDPGAIVYALVAMPTHYSMVKRFFGIDLLPLSDDEAVAQFIDLLLNGLRTRPEKTPK